MTRGRPPTDPRGTYDVIMQVRYRSEDADIVRRAARRLGLRASTFVRMASLEQARRDEIRAQLAGRDHSSPVRPSKTSTRPPRNTPSSTEGPQS